MGEVGKAVLLSDVPLALFLVTYTLLSRCLIPIVSWKRTTQSRSYLLPLRLQEHFLIWGSAMEANNPFHQQLGYSTSWATLWNGTFREAADGSGEAWEQERAGQRERKGLWPLSAGRPRWQVSNRPCGEASGEAVLQVLAAGHSQSHRRK